MANQKLVYVLKDQKGNFADKRSIQRWEKGHIYTSFKALSSLSDMYVNESVANDALKTLTENMNKVKSKPNLTFRVEQIDLNANFKSLKTYNQFRDNLVTMEI